MMLVQVPASQCLLADDHGKPRRDSLFGYGRGAVSNTAEAPGGYYAVGVGIPFVWVEAKGQVTGPLGNTFTKRDKASGIGDILLYPFMLAGLASRAT